jgi:colanic acid/amylovoran biosynthesis glycosyltransferase
MKITILTAKYPHVTRTFVFEPVRWIEAQGHQVSVIASQRTSLADTYAAPVPSLTVESPGRGDLAVGARHPLRFLRNLGRARAVDGWATLSTTRIAQLATLPAVAGADHLLAHFGPFGLRWLPVAAAARRRFSVFFHGYDCSGYPKKWPGVYEQLFTSGAGLLTNSDHTRSRLVELGAPPDRVGVVRLAADPAFRRASRSPCTIPRRILTIGRLVPKKGIDDSLEAFARSRRATPEEWRYEVIGEGRARGELESLVEKHGLQASVELRGFVGRSEVLESLSAASLFVLASKTAPSGDSEGTPVSIMEAATLGVPVVSTLHAGIPELLPPQAEREGFLVREGDVEALTTAITRLMRDSGLRQQWGEACRSFALSHYSPERHARNLVAALEQYARVPTLERSTKWMGTSS